MFLLCDICNQCSVCSFKQKVFFVTRIHWTWWYQYISIWVHAIQLWSWWCDVYPVLYLHCNDFMLEYIKLNENARLMMMLPTSSIYVGVLTRIWLCTFVNYSCSINPSAKYDLKSDLWDDKITKICIVAGSREGWGEYLLKEDNFQPAGSTPKPYMDFLLQGGTPEDQ